MTDAPWGERRAAERDARRRRRGGWLVASAILIALGSRFVAGFIDGASGRPSRLDASPVESVVVALALLIVVSLIGRRIWRDLDEVQRGEMLATLATIGLAGVVARPLLLIAQPALHLADPQAAAWFVGLIAGLLVLTRLWWRR